MAFDGTADYTLDAKNRLNVPARFRDLLQDGVVLAKSTDPCVQIWPREAYEAHRRSIIGQLNPGGQQATMAKRFFAANSHPTELDSAGRVMVPPFLMDHATLGKEVTVIGADDHLEVWDRQAWTTYNEKLTAEILALSESFDAAGPAA
ncbi:MAG TPA: division/cell wall cluster transcriptional repressor MraZ [Baekduia sp.]|nr:division/cell wall cluster transcriptional repressor MraZ [Baekduia sp.]